MTDENIRDARDRLQRLSEGGLASTLTHVLHLRGLFGVALGELMKSAPTAAEILLASHVGRLIADLAGTSPQGRPLCAVGQEDAAELTEALASLGRKLAARFPRSRGESLCAIYSVVLLLREMATAITSFMPVMPSGRTGDPPCQA